jgi:FdhE protein
MAQRILQPVQCSCHGYRKILHQVKNPHVEPVPDDLASLNLDLLLGQAGHHGAGGGPLPGQPDEN